MSRLPAPRIPGGPTAGTGPVSWRFRARIVPLPCAYRDLLGGHLPHTLGALDGRLVSSQPNLARTSFALDAHMPTSSRSPVIQTGATPRALDVELRVTGIELDGGSQARREACGDEHAACRRERCRTLAAHGCVKAPADGAPRVAQILSGTPKAHRTRRQGRSTFLISSAASRSCVKRKDQARGLALMGSGSPHNGETRVRSTENFRNTWCPAPYSTHCLRSTNFWLCRRGFCRSKRSWVNHSTEGHHNKRVWGPQCRA